MSGKSSTNASKGNYGIAEWYGKLFRYLDDSTRKQFAEDGKRECPFFASAPDLAPQGKTDCNKKSGVCSIRNFILNDDEEIVRFEAIATTCPNRFLEDRVVFSKIGEVLIGTKAPKIVKEIPFLQRLPLKDPGLEAGLLTSDPPSKNDAEGVQAEEPGQTPESVLREDVGRIDMVCVNPEDRSEWCAVEMQAVYFSGGAMSKDFRAIREYEGNGYPAPAAARRPDFRSSGPKRLMPQLQIKVPTLRRWGKKMAVVIDEAFFISLGTMDHVPHVSNADIVWIIVGFNENSDSGTAQIVIKDTKYTTLERAVEGLTAGIPTSKDEFERKIAEKLDLQSRK